MLPQKILEFLSFLARSGATIALNWSTLAMHSLRTCVTVVLTANTHTLRSGEHTDHVILKIQIAILRGSISTTLSCLGCGLRD